MAHLGVGRHFLWKSIWDCMSVSESLTLALSDKWNVMVFVPWSTQRPLRPNHLRSPFNHFCDLSTCRQGWPLLISSWKKSNRRTPKVVSWWVRDRFSRSSGKLMAFTVRNYWQISQSCEAAQRMVQSLPWFLLPSLFPHQAPQLAPFQSFLYIFVMENGMKIIWVSHPHFWTRGQHSCRAILSGPATKRMFTLFVKLDPASQSKAW